MKALLILFAAITSATAQPKLSRFVTQELNRQFPENRPENSNEGRPNTYASIGEGLQAPIAWGIGSYRIAESYSVLYQWFAWTSPHGLIQFRVDVKIHDFDLRKIREIKTLDGERWKALHEGNLTYIAASSDWADKRGYCHGSVSRGRTVNDMTDPERAPEYWDRKCDLTKALRDEIFKLHRQCPWLRLTVREVMTPLLESSARIY